MEKIAAVTFWIDEPLRIIVFNGFSFVAHAVPFDHCFVNPVWASNSAVREQLRVQLAGYDRIYCSVTATCHLEPLRPIVDGRWFFGGPAFSARKHPPVPNWHQGTLESLLGMPPSTTFTDYWTGHPALPRKPVFFTCSLGRGCYWNQCTFCDYKDSDRAFSKKDDVAKILSQLTHPESTAFVHLCVASCTPPLLEEVLAAGHKGTFTFVCFCRADAALVQFVKNYGGSLAGLFLSLGVETLSSAAMAILGKGFDFEAVLEMTQAALEKGAHVEWNIMDNLPFLNSAMAEEYEVNLARAAQRFGLNKRHLIYNNGQIIWPTASVAGKFGPFRELPDGRATSVIRFDQPAHEANLRAGQAILRSGIILNGEKFGAALGHRPA